MGCIYMYMNLINKKCYIGKSHSNGERRRKDHIAGRGSKLLKRAFDKYGIENFSFEILDDGILDTFLDDYEIKAIAKYNSIAPNGYNLTYGGGCGKWSDEAREAIKGEKHHNYGKPSHLRGKPLSVEHRLKISKARKGKQKGKDHYNYGKPSYFRGGKHTAEARRKISRAMRGENSPNYGKTASDETRRKLSESHRRPEYDPEFVFHLDLHTIRFRCKQRDRDFPCSIGSKSLKI